MMNNQTNLKNTLPTIALIGCGAIAEKFYLPALRQFASGVEKVILVDNNPDRAAHLAASFGGAESVSDYRDILHRIQGAIVAVPHHLHVPISKDLLTHKVHVLCEKPLAETGEEVREMVRLAEANGVTIAVNNTRRLVPSSRKIKDIIAGGGIGSLRSIRDLEGGEFDWPTASGFYFNSKISRKGVLLDLGAHVFDVICFWLGGKPEILSSESDSFGGCEAVVAVSMKYQDCLCTVRMSRLGKLPNSFRIVGEKGSIEGAIHDWRTITLTTSRGTSMIDTQSRDNGKVHFSRMPVANFLDVIGGAATPLIPASHVLDSIELIQEAYSKSTRFHLPWYERKEVVDAD